MFNKLARLFIFMFGFYFLLTSATLYSSSRIIFYCVFIILGSLTIIQVYVRLNLYYVKYWYYRAVAKKFLIVQSKKNKKFQEEYKGKDYLQFYDQLYEQADTYKNYIPKAYEDLYF